MIGLSSSASKTRAASDNDPSDARPNCRRFCTCSSSLACLQAPQVIDHGIEQAQQQQQA
jgi:hypothetical protein